MDQIKINHLEVYCNHGVFQEEKVLGQKFLISATLFVDIRKPGLTDDLTKTIHYGKVSHYIERFMKNNTYQLIESAAEHLAMDLLLEFPIMEKIKIEIQKPWAPIGLPLENVAVEITRGWHTAYIALGSNIGDKKAYLDGAIAGLKKINGCQVTKVSDYIVTEPVSEVEQDDFLNACLEMKTLLPPYELLDELHRLELEAGRERIIRWGPRTLDLDIIFYDKQIFDSENLTIPHLEMHKRGFVLEPMMQIAPYYRHPLLKKTVREMMEEMECEL